MEFGGFCGAGPSFSTLHPGGKRLGCGLGICAKGGRFGDGLLEVVGFGGTRRERRKGAKGARKGKLDGFSGRDAE